MPHGADVDHANVRAWLLGRLQQGGQQQLGEEGVADVIGPCKMSRSAQKTELQIVDAPTELNLVALFGL